MWTFKVKENSNWGSEVRPPTWTFKVQENPYWGSEVRPPMWTFKEDPNWGSEVRPQMWLLNLFNLVMRCKTFLVPWNCVNVTSFNPTSSIIINFIALCCRISTEPGVPTLAPCGRRTGRGPPSYMDTKYSMMGASSEVSTADNFLYTDLYMCVQVKTTKNVYYYPIMVHLALWITSYNYRLSRNGLASENLIPGPIRLLWRHGCDCVGSSDSRTSTLFPTATQHH